MEISNFIFFSFLISSVYGETSIDTACDSDWERYKNEKCIKVFDLELQSYKDAEDFCKFNYNANLISIGLEEKQKFIERFLKSKGIINEIWIGLNYESDNKYVWSDDTLFDYSNWDTGRPNYNASYCVQMYTDNSELGKWADVSCSKKNVVLCEKIQPWSLDTAKMEVMNFKQKIESEIMNIKKNLVPIGFTYVQLPKEKPPSEIWPLMTWNDVSSDYAGVFFRVEGGNSAYFGTVQEEAVPRITLVEASETKDYSIFVESLTLPPDDEQSEFIHTGTFDMNNFNRFRGIAFSYSNEEVRPRNMAVRIWKRTQ